MPARYAILISRLQSAPVYWRNELRVGPLIAHHQTVFVTAVQHAPMQQRKLSTNIITTKPQRIIVHQPSSPLPVMRSPRITTCRLLTRFSPVNSVINRNAVATESSSGKFLVRGEQREQISRSEEFMILFSFFIIFYCSGN